MNEDSQQVIDSEDSDINVYSGNNNGESIVEKPTMDTFFNCENLILSIEKTMKGFQKEGNEWVYRTKPKARDSFINAMVNSLRSVINQQNMISDITEDQANYILLEKCKEFIFFIYDEPSIDDEDIETIINMYDHAMQIFLGQVIGGFGARTFRQVSANVAYELENKSNNSFLNNLFSKK